MRSKLTTFLIIIISNILISPFCFSQKKNSKVDFHAKTLSGKEIHLSEFKNYIIVINIWATWCSGCVEEIPDLNILYDIYKNDSVLFLAITDDKDEKIRSFLEKREFKYEHIVNAKELIEIFKKGPLDVRPKHIIIAKNGTVAIKKMGARENIVEILSKHIERLL